MQGEEIKVQKSLRNISRTLQLNSLTTKLFHNEHFKQYTLQQLIFWYHYTSINCMPTVQLMHL